MANNTSNNGNYFITQSHVNLLWEQGIKGEGITIGVVDTCFDVTHPMLADNFVCGKNFSDDGRSVDDITGNHYHGTAVASLACGKYYNYRCYGIAPNAKLVCAKVLNESGRGSHQAITNGINYCVEQGCDIINCSIGCESDSLIMQEAVKNAVKNGVSIVVSSGNDGHDDIGTIDELSYPGSYPESICVGAIDCAYHVADFSNSNNCVDIVAPGVNVLTAYPQNRHAFCDGTSFASPIIAGCLALLKQKFRIDYKRDPSESELYAQLIKYTRGLQGYEINAIGNGYVDFSITRVKR